MTHRENVEFYIAALQRALKEYQQTRFYHEALARRKEMLLYTRQLEMHLAYLDSEIAAQYKLQTGVKAIRGLWKKLGTQVKTESIPNIDKHEKNNSQGK